MESQQWYKCFKSVSDRLLAERTSWSWFKHTKYIAPNFVSHERRCTINSNFYLCHTFGIIPTATKNSRRASHIARLIFQEIYDWRYHRKSDPPGLSQACEKVDHSQAFLFSFVFFKEPLPGGQVQKVQGMSAQSFTQIFEDLTAYNQYHPRVFVDRCALFDFAHNTYAIPGPVVKLFNNLHSIAIDIHSFIH